MWVGPRLLIAPGSRFRTLWDTFSIVLIIYLAAVLPYRIAFVKEWSVAHAVFDFIIDLYFISDIILNFFTCYVRIRAPHSLILTLLSFSSLFYC